MDITIYQINMGRDHNRIAFEGLDLLKMYQGSDKIDSRIYDRVFEGEVDCNDLEDVYRKFNLEHPEGYKGRSLSVSDLSKSWTRTAIRPSTSVTLSVSNRSTDPT